MFQPCPAGAGAHARCGAAAMSLGQTDYDILAELLPSAKTLVAAFEAFIADAGFVVWRRYKEPGGHLTPFWLQARMSTRAPSASVVQFGCTAFAEVNDAPHMYVRAKEPGA